MIRVGSIVKRIHAKEDWQLGSTGEVVDVIPFRKVRVLWTRQPRADGSIRKISIRTWVDIQDVQEVKEQRLTKH